MLMNLKNINDYNLQEIIDEVKATQSIEGLYMTKEEEILFRKYLSGDISEKDVLNNFRECVKKVLEKSIKPVWKSDFGV